MAAENRDARSSSHTSLAKITRAKGMRNVSLVLNYYSTGTVEAAHFFFIRFTHSWRLLGRTRLSGPVSRTRTRERQTGRSSKQAWQLKWAADGDYKGALLSQGGPQYPKLSL